MKFGKFRSGRAEKTCFNIAECAQGAKEASEREGDQDKKAPRTGCGGSRESGNGRSDSGRSGNRHSDSERGRGELSDEVLQDRGNLPCVLDMSAEMPPRGGLKRVVWTGKELQLVTERIGSFSSGDPVLNEGGDVAMYVTAGEGEVRIGAGKCNMREPIPLRAGCEILIPSGAYWYIRSSEKRPLELITCYAPRRYPFGHSE